MKVKVIYDKYNNEEVEILKEGGTILRRILLSLGTDLKIGMESMKIDELAEKRVLEAGAEIIFKGYKPKGAVSPFPANICISVNDEAAHGVPGKYKFQNGDIVKLDLGLKYKSLIVDSAYTFIVGEADKEKSELIEVTKEALEIGIKNVKAGVYVGDIGKEIGKYVKSKGYTVIDSLWGHAVGQKMHAEPNIPHYDTGQKLEMLEEGMVIAIEPHVKIGKNTDLKLSKDNWTLKTKGGEVVAQFEHTIYVDKDKGLVLT